MKTKKCATFGISCIMMLSLMTGCAKSEKIDYEKCVTGLRDWTIQEGTKKTDYLKGVKWDKEYIKKVTVDDDKVKTDKQGTYEITYLIDIKDEKEKDIEKEYKVKVVSKEEAKKEADKGKEVVTEEGIKNEKKTDSPKSEPTSKKEDKTDNTVSQAKPNNKPSQPAKPGHKHHWVEQFKTIHHDAIYENKYIVDQAAYDSQEPIYDIHEICNICGTDLTANNIEPWKHGKEHALAGEGAGGHHDEQVIVGYETVHHPEVGHNEKILVKNAWDEQVSNGFRCDCGATK